MTGVTPLPAAVTVMLLNPFLTNDTCTEAGGPLLVDSSLLCILELIVPKRDKSVMVCVFCFCFWDFLRTYDTRKTVVM